MRPPGVFPCEHSSRQMWKWRVSPKDPRFGYLQLLVSVVTDEDPTLVNEDLTSVQRSRRRERRRLQADESEATFRCMGRGDDNRQFLKLWDCFPPGEWEREGSFVCSTLLQLQADFSVMSMCTIHPDDADVVVVVVVVV